MSKAFQYKAESTERYLREIGPKIVSRKAYGPIHDMHLAEMLVYMQLYGKTFLNSRKEFMAALHGMKSSPPPVREKVFDQVVFDGAYYREIDSLIARYSTSEQP